MNPLFADAGYWIALLNPQISCTPKRLWWADNAKSEHCYEPSGTDGVSQSIYCAERVKA